MSPSPRGSPLDWLAGYGPGWVYAAVFGGLLVHVLVRASIMRALKPDHPLARLAPQVLFPAALRAIRWRAANARALIATAIHRKRRAARVRQAERAAFEAADDDPALAPQRIRKAADALLRLACLAWDARDPARLATLMSPELVRAWQRALDADGRPTSTQIPDDVRIELVSLTAHPATEITATVLIEAELYDPDDPPAAPIFREESGTPAPRRLAQYWTLARHDGLWIVQAIEERAEGDRHLSAALPAHAEASGQVVRLA